MVIEKFTTGLRLHQHPHAQSRQINVDYRSDGIMTPEHA